jgi:uncharacterized protein (TIGR02145 family)
LYNHYAVNDPRNLAPEGWRIPTETDFNSIMNLKDMYAGKEMKSKTGWDKADNYDSHKATNSTGFDAKPAGKILNMEEIRPNVFVGKFFPFGAFCGFWTPAINSYSEGTVITFTILSEVRIEHQDRGSGFSVRCIKVQ